MPTRRPRNPNFSSGPCAKRQGWTPAALNDAVVGRSHRSKPAKAKLREVIALTREILGIPNEYRIAIVPASDTGAVEMALWSLLGGPCKGPPWVQQRWFGFRSPRSNRRSAGT
jgi:phosphoserine aminotransferase